MCRGLDPLHVSSHHELNCGLWYVLEGKSKLMWIPEELSVWLVGWMGNWSCTSDFDVPGLATVSGEVSFEGATEELVTVDVGGANRVAEGDERSVDFASVSFSDEFVDGWVFFPSLLCDVFRVDEGIWKRCVDIITHKTQERVKNESVFLLFEYFSPFAIKGDSPKK